MKKSIVLLGALAALAGGYVFLISPLDEKRVELAERLHERYETLAEYEAFIEGAGQAGTALKSISGELEAMRKNLIPRADHSIGFSQLQITIQNTAKASGLRITSIKPLSAKSIGLGKNGYTELPIHIDAEGGIGELSGFLKLLDAPEVFIGVDRLDIAVSEGNRLKVKMQLSGLMA